MLHLPFRFVYVASVVQINQALLVLLTYGIGLPILSGGLIHDRPDSLSELDRKVPDTGVCF
jgi:hypothetical protein